MLTSSSGLCNLLGRMLKLLTVALFILYFMQVDVAKKRVKWLQDRLEKILLTARSYCHLYNRSLQRSKVRPCSMA